MVRKNYRMHGQASQDLFYEKKGHQRGTPGAEGDLQRNKKPQDPTMHGQICGSKRLMQRKRKQNKNGLSRNQRSTMPDD